MEVQIISREILKPSLPTSEHLRTYKLCVFDQLAPPVYIPFTLFYLAKHENPRTNSDIVKKSLSKTLSLFYPFAGRLNDDRLTIDCNDDGALFIEAQVGCEMSFVVEDEPEIEVLQQLLPVNPRHHLPHDQADQSSADDHRVMLAVQISYFACGGMAIGVCVSHVIADAAAAANFVRIWAQFACGDPDNITINVEGLIYDCSYLFPSQDLSNFFRVLSPIDERIHVQLPEEKVVIKRFCFDGYKIAALRNEIRDGLSLYHPTRVEAVTALIWEALIAATAEINGTLPIFVVAKSVNLRKRMNPPLPQQFIGNVGFSKMVSSLNLRIKNRCNLAKKIHESIKDLDDECMREVIYMGTDEWLNDLMVKACEEFEKNSKTGIFYFSSWCRFPFYEADFGWGKPFWIEAAFKVNRTAILMDSSDGKGIEAWISLSKEEMVKLEQHHGICAYSTFKPSI